MNEDFKPTGYNSLSPYFVVRNARRFIDLMKEIFHAEELRRYHMHDGTIMHMELKIDDSIIMLGESSEEYPPTQSLIHVYVADVDSIFKKAIELGCTVVKEPEEKTGDPDRRGTFKDFSGNLWSIATQKTIE